MGFPDSLRWAAWSLFERRLASTAPVIPVEPREWDVFVQIAGGDPDRAALAEELLAGWEGVRTLVGCKRLRQLRRLALVGGRMGGAGTRILAESPHVASLKALALPDQSLGQPGAQALAGSRYLTELEVLDLTGNNLARSAIPILASSANLPRLRRLILAYNLLQDSDARALANSPPPPRTAGVGPFGQWHYARGHRGHPQLTAREAVAATGPITGRTAGNDR